MNEDQQWQQNTDDHKRYDDAILELHSAIYGDKNGNMGMRKQLEEMYSVFVPVTLTGKAVIKVIMILGALASAIVAVLEMIGLIKSHKL
jgi:hypothetical protein